MPNLAMNALTEFKHALIHADEDSDRGADPFVRLAKAMAEEKMRGIEAFYARLAAKFPDSRFGRLGFDFVASRVPNGFAIRVPEDDSYAIGVDPTLHEMLTWMFVGAHWAYRKNEPDFFLQLAVDFVRLGWLNMPVSDEKKRLLLAFVQGVLPEYQDIGAWASATCMHFLIAHEIAHIHLGHFEKGQAKKMRLALSMSQENEVSGFEHDREFEADAWAGKALLDLSTGVWENILSRTVPSIIFGILAIIDDLYLPTTPLGNHVRLTHPPSVRRSEALKLIGAVETQFPMPEQFRILFSLPEFLSSLRLTPKFQEFAKRHGQYYSGLQGAAG